MFKNLKALEEKILYLFQCNYNMFSFIKKFGFNFITEWMHKLIES